MSYFEDRAIKSLEAQVARAQAKLDEGRPGSPINFLSGLALGTVAGALLAFYFTREEALPEEVAPRDNDPILLRQTPTGTTGASTTPRPLAAMPSAPEPGVPDQLAAAELESPVAIKDIASETAAKSTNEVAGAAKPATPAAAGGRVEPVDGACPASHPIKGNKSSMGALIYHTPASASYDRTRPEACFATEAEAEAAGYRAPRG
jgi:hypothetical protein